MKKATGKPQTFLTYDQAKQQAMAEPGKEFIAITLKSNYLAILNMSSSLEEDSAEPDSDEPYLNIEYAGGIFGSSSGETEIYCDDDIPEELKKDIIFVPAHELGLQGIDIMDSMAEYVLHALISDIESPDAFDSTREWTKGALATYQEYMKALPKTWDTGWDHLAIGQ